MTYGCAADDMQIREMPLESGAGAYLHLRDAIV